MKLTHQLIAVADAYCRGRGLSRARVSTLVLNNGAKLDKIAIGTADLATGTFERALRWFSDNWPDGADWPEGVARPVLAGDAAGPGSAGGSVGALSPAAGGVGGKRRGARERDRGFENRPEAR